MDLHRLRRRDQYVGIEDSGLAGEPDATAWLEHGIQLNLVSDKMPDHAKSTPLRAEPSQDR